jgi:hypothetical protein
MVDLVEFVHFECRPFLEFRTYQNVYHVADISTSLGEAEVQQSADEHV